MLKHEANSDKTCPQNYENDKKQPRSIMNERSATHDKGY